jgi:hypothetical protein
MAGPALDFSYRYRGRSELRREGDGGQLLSLATSGGVADHPYFFSGQVRQPRLTADLLRALLDVVRARFHIPAAALARIIALADPVVTCNDSRLRMEAFSGCASAYARVDFLPEAVETAGYGRGTTNVDFHGPLVAALAQVRDRDRMTLAVGSQSLELFSRRAYVGKPASRPEVEEEDLLGRRERRRDILLG